MNRTSDLLHWLARTRPGNIVAAGIGAAVAAVIFVLAAVVSHADTSGTSTPDAPREVLKLVDTTTMPSAPSVNLTPNDPAYMTTTPAPIAPLAQADDPVTSTPAPPETSVAPTTEAPRTTTPPMTTPPVVSPSPQADPNIIPIVIAWDGVKCAQADSWYQPMPGSSPVLLCPSSIRP